jgi:hypothetical protein
MNLLATPASPDGDQVPPSSPTSSASASPSTWRTRRVAAITGIALLVGFGAWFAISNGSGSSGAGAPAAASAQKLTGSFTIFGGGTAADACAGAGATGEALKVTNATGRVLTQGTLGTGTPVAIGHGCAYSFSVPRPASANAYLVEVGTRGNLSFTRAQMAAAHWKLAINIGTQQPTG